jgi:hypothetical protein
VELDEEGSLQKEGAGVLGAAFHLTKCENKLR